MRSPGVLPATPRHFAPLETPCCAFPDCGACPQGTAKLGRGPTSPENGQEPPLIGYCPREFFHPLLLLPWGKKSPGASPGRALGAQVGGQVPRDGNALGHRVGPGHAVGITQI